MPRPNRRLLHALFAAIAVAVAPFTAASAASLAVHPFASDDPLLGMAISSELAASFGGMDVVIGPEVAAGAVPPVMASGGFIGLTRVIGADPMYGPAGPDLLRGGLGVDVAVSGRVLVLDDSYRLELVVAGPGGVTNATVEEPHGRRDRIVALAARVVAKAFAGPVSPTPPDSPPLDGAYATYMTALVYASGGLTDDAASLLASVPGGELPARGLRLEEDLVAAADLASADDLASTTRRLRRALLSLGVDSFDADASYGAFQAIVNDTGLPVAGAWAAVLAASVGDYATAASDLQTVTATGSYGYGRALDASLAWAQGDTDAALAKVDSVTEGAAALLGASIVAQMAQDPARETAALNALTRAAPFLTYPFERLSFLAFDRGDALAAAEALLPAVELDPESDLYWTNLGWAYYLLGFLDRSEEASNRAVELDANQYIARYNLGLVYSVTGRLTQAIEAYDRAIGLDPGVDDEAVKDLEKAVQEHPGAVAVHYSLGYLYDAEGRRDDARRQLRTFVRLAGAAGDYADFVSAARERLVALDAPPPPLEILGKVVPRLGVRGPEAEPFHPGDRVFPVFEVSTPGEQLPNKLNVTLTLTDPGGKATATASGEIVVPSGAVGYVIDSLGIDVPEDASAGTYTLAVTVDGIDGTHVEDSTSLEVDGLPDTLRQLLSRGVVMTSLSTSTPLYSVKDLGAPGRLVSSLLEELASGAAAAEAALPTVTDGRFAGLTGGELFSTSTAEDVEDYLAYLIASGVSDYRFVFVDGYAQWALDGAPTKE